ncbi:MAG: vanadium-dependent haloperoxidase [Rhodobacteraceae bacterium]|nr:vanadium-dependent haloperoxidase [Paracoccaceae bacterium]
MPNDRKEEAFRVRVEAAQHAKNRTHPDHRANPDEARFASANFAMSFTKGLDHDYASGTVLLRDHFDAFRSCINSGFVAPFTTAVPVPRDDSARTVDANGVVKEVRAPSGDPSTRRQWEAPTAGTAFDLEGPDAQAVTMPPAPAACTNELAYEMAEVYELALLRDEPFHAFDAHGGSAALTQSIARLNALPYCTEDNFNERPRMTDASGKLDSQTAFRGSAPGAADGPYVSQLLHIGNADRNGTTDAVDGYIAYGAQRIDQRVAEAKAGDDYMMRWDDWFEVQQGFAPDASQDFSPANRRFIHTPRDLATYVHFDALYQAYLNATLILWSNGTPLDPNFDHLSGASQHAFMTNAVTGEKAAANAGGFALYGGPHILTLVTEVATRALKAVRYQKFNTHLRLRPEALAARLEKADWFDKEVPSTCKCFGEMREQIVETVEAIRAHNQGHPNGGDATALLPMAFGEGSPMHPTYGAGHATVAGACTTIVKAFFDTSALFGLHKDTDQPGFYASSDIKSFVQYESMEHGCKLKPKEPHCPLTLEGELNKLAANISIGRNMAGVHYFSDYYDSLRMGEAIAIGMLEEQALCYPTDEFVMSIPTFDGDIVRIGAR